MRDYSIRAEKLVRYVGVYSPFVVYSFGKICDSELFSHVCQSTNQPHLTTFLSWRIYLIAHTPKNCRLEFICQDFQSLKLIQFRTPPPNAPILPLLCVKFGRFEKTSFFNFFRLLQKLHTLCQKRTYNPYSMCYQLLRGRIPKGLLQRIKGYSSAESTIRGILCLVHLD
jgi:hypothetical protein